MPATGLVDQVDRIVTALGFAETTPTRALSDVVEHHFADKGVKVTVIDLRYGTLTIAASPRDVALVHADTPAVIEAARDNGLELDDLRVRTRR